MAVSDTGAATSATAVVPSDSTVVSYRSLYVGGAGNVSVMCVEDNVAAVFAAVPAGTILPVSVNRVMAATTATLILGLK